MNKYLLITILFFSLKISFAQTKPKPKEKPPTQKEMADMMKEMQGALDSLSPEDKKMMDSMGLKMPDMHAIKKTVAGINDAQIKKAVENENRIVPPKDAARISMALSVTVSNAEMAGYINKTHQKVLNQLSADTKTQGGEIFQKLVTHKSSVANTAVGFWIDGKPTMALYLMGEACKADPANSLNLNNYASFLTMCGAEQLAIPILNNLNKTYPKNSSILNNLAQAWLGLGDIGRAEKYADSCIRIYAAHPQANMAKCVIEESKGKIPQAIEAAKKSISKAYSSEKENKLKKLGYNLKSDDINWDRPMPQDALGLGKISWPDFPLNVEESERLEKEWDDFIVECQKKRDKLGIEIKAAELEYEKKSAWRIEQLLQAGQKGQFVQPLPGYAAKALIKLKPRVEDIYGTTSFVFANELEKVFRAIDAAEEHKNLLTEKQAAINEKYKDLIGEGKPNPFEEICKDENIIRSEFLNIANGGLSSAYKTYFNYARRRTSDLLYCYQYTMWPEQFELVKLFAQNALVGYLNQQVYFEKKSSWCQTKTTPPEKKPIALQDFDDVSCQYVSTMNLGIFKITSSCSNLTGEFDFEDVKINYKSNVETGRFSGTAIVGVSESNAGPLGLDAEGFIGGLVEWDNTGITDVGAVVNTNVNAGGQNLAGANVKVTVNSGVSRNVSTILQGVK